jgi:holo-[acyl-carrier protein] synthase
MTAVLPLDQAGAPTEAARPTAGGGFPAGRLDALAQDAGRTAADLLVGDPTAIEVRVGVDLVEVADIAHSVETFGDRYVRRIFTPHEIECCRLSPATAPGGTALVGTAPVGQGAAAYSLDSLASRFAAKEAVVKVLRPAGPRPEWRTIEVHRADSGWCELRLTGLAALLAEQAGVEQLAVSMTHEAGVGAAVVTAVARPDRSVPD